MRFRSKIFPLEGRPPPCQASCSGSVPPHSAVASGLLGLCRPVTPSTLVLGSLNGSPNSALGRTRARCQTRFLTARASRYPKIGIIIQLVDGNVINLLNILISCNLWKETRHGKGKVTLDFTPGGPRSAGAYNSAQGKSNPRQRARKCRSGV